MTRRALVAVAAIAAVLAAAVAAFDTTPSAAERNEGSTTFLRDTHRRIAAGSQHTCALLDTGAVQCWGDNALGQLGNTTVAATNEPTTVPGITTAIGITAGASHTCALLHGGGVTCWGLNGSGQLGDGTTTNRTAPTPVTGLAGAVAVAAGGFHTCALTAAGGVRCWGHDGSGQLGDGPSLGTGAGTATVPVVVSGVSSATAVTAGEFHTCATLADGSVRCWGHNGFGQLGDGTTLDRHAPVAVSGIPDGTHLATAVTAGNAHTCAVLDDGKARCWGNARRGQLGNNADVEDDTNPPPDRTTPVVVKFDADPSFLGVDPQDQTGITSIAAGAFHTCARIVGGSARCWGDNGRGQLGDGTTGGGSKFVRAMAVPVAGLAGATALTAGGFHTCALAGTAMSCWGYNFFGQLGSYASSSLVPVTVTALRGAENVVVGTHHACARTLGPGTPPRHVPRCWGRNTNGELGAGLDPATVPRSIIPVAVSGLADVAALSAGNGHVCALPTAGTTPSCWGRNEHGQLGNGTTTPADTPVAVANLSGVTQLSAHGTAVPAERGHTCARLGDGTARCWGRNLNGQLGDGSTADATTPVEVRHDHDGDPTTAPVPLTGVAAVAAGGLHSCALMADSGVRCWGRNGNGQIGDNTTTDRHLATRVKVVDNPHPDPDVFLSGVTAVTAGAFHTCASSTDGRVRCWGANGSGQVGDGTTAQRHLPRLVANIPEPFAKTKATALSAGDDHTCALLENTSIRCWGENGAGQLGTGGTGDSSTPVAPVDLGNPDQDILDNVGAFITSFSAGRDNTCVTLVDTSVRCSGDNADGQLGDGIGATRTTPTPVLGLAATIGANSIPAPGDDAYTTPPGTVVAFSPSLLANDTDPAPNATALTAAKATDPAHGTAAVNADGTGSYAPAAGFCGVDSFTYSATDGTATVPATVTLTVPCPNDPPVAAADAAVVAEEGAVVVNVLANDTDDEGDPLTVAAAAGAARGTTVVVAGGVQYTPDADYCGPDAFTYDVSDGPGGHTVTGTVSVTVTCVNDAPVATDDAGATPEDTPIVVDVVANDHDIDSPSIAVAGIGAPAHGTATPAGPSAVEYTPHADFCGSDGFEYTLSDGTDTDVGSVFVSVSCANDTPGAADDAATTAEDTAVTVDVLGNDVDADGDALSIGAVADPPHGTAVPAASGVVYTPDADHCGTDAFGYTAADGNGGSDTATVVVTITCGNDQPAATDDAAATTEDTPVGVDPLANDTDPDAGTTLALSAVTDPAHGTVELAPGDALLYRPDADFCGADTFTYTVTDGAGGTDTGLVSVAVACVNDAPLLAPVANRTTAWGEVVSIAVTATDPDAGDAVTYELVAPVPAGATIDPATGAFSWTPSASQIGTHTLTVRASDGEAADEASFAVTVLGRRTALQYTGALSGQHSDPVAVSATLTDEDGPVGGQPVVFTVGSQTATAVTDGAGVATTVLTLTGVAGPTSARVAFAGGGGFGAASEPIPFVTLKERVSVSFTGSYLTLTTGTSASVALTAVLTEESDGSPSAGGPAGTQVSFRTAAPGGAVLCSALAASSTPGAPQAAATCTAPDLSLGSRALVVQASGDRHGGPVDVVVATVAQATSGSASGAGRVPDGTGSASFGFQARPVRRAAPEGDAVHVFRSGGFAYVVRSTSLTSLTAGCAAGKPKVCTSTLQLADATTTAVLLADGSVPVVAPGTSALRIDATDAAEPTAGSVPADRYAVSITGATTYDLGAPGAQVPIGAGNVRVPG